MKSRDVEEVELLRDNVLWLKQRMPVAIKNWKIRDPNCNFSAGLVRDLCYKPANILPEIFDPLIKWLSDYILYREGRIKLNNVDDFLRVGLVNIYRFVLLADTFMKNSHYFIPSNMPRSIKSENEYREFINILLSKLIGCNKQLNFLFIDLSKTIKGLVPELVQMQNFLQNECLSLRIENLRS